MPGVTITRDPRAIVVGVLLLLSVFVVAFVWPVLGWHARGIILAGYGITLGLIMLIPAQRTRRRLRSGVRPRVPCWARKRTRAGHRRPHRPLLPPGRTVHRAGWPRG
jgi:hypothetical protein